MYMFIVSIALNLILHFSMLSWVVIDVVVRDRSSSFVSLVLYVLYVLNADDDDGEEGVVVGGRRREVRRAG